jgi:kynurenine formamidase
MKKIICQLLLCMSVSGYVSAQDWHMPPDSQRCPSKWGEGDQRGAANMMTPQSVLAAMQLVRTGQVFELGEVLTTDPQESYINRGRVFNIYPKPAIPIPNKRVSHEELVITELGQVGTQLDGFAHQMYGESFYNCFQYKDIMTRNGFTKLGIENVGSLISRGVLIDIAGLKGVDILPQDYEITDTDLKQALQKQGVKLQPGDTVLFYTGWGRHRGKDNRLYGSDNPGIGIAAGLFLVEQQVMVVGADNCCIEFRSAERDELPLHSMLLIQHGIYMVENMELQALAEARVYEFAFVMQPLKLKGATGAAVAPIAIR